MRPVTSFEVFEFDAEDFWKVKELKELRRRVREVAGGMGHWVEGEKVLGGKGRVAVVCVQDELDSTFLTIGEFFGSYRGRESASSVTELIQIELDASPDHRSTSSTTPTPPSPSSDLTPQPSFKRTSSSAPIHSLFASASASTTSSLDRSFSSRLASPSSILLDYHLEIDLDAESPLSSLVSLTLLSGDSGLDLDKGPITSSLFVPSSSSNADASAPSFSHRSNASSSSTMTWESEGEMGPMTPEWKGALGGRRLSERKGTERRE
ncbi:hypothetical protein BDY24DRAFT_398164 [Mrakia frigida]|uniref:uncharacterized protein n=1 Tax=Mrakia frigida TaxID=29902 RepID=UPI003FCC2713